MSYPIVYFEIAGRDSKKLQQFYEAVFGWKIDGEVRPGYGFLKTETPGGILWGIRQDPPDKVMYIQVPDLQERLDVITAHGGETVIPPTAVPGVVTFALFKDPEGNLLGLVLGKAS